MDRAYRVVLFALAAACALAVVVLTAVPLLTLFGGFLFSLILHGVSSAIARWTKIRYGVCLSAVLLFLVGAAVLGAIGLGPTLKEQVRDLVTRVPAAFHDLTSRLRQATGAALPSAGLPDPKLFTSGATAALSAVVEIVGASVVVTFVGVYGAARPDDYTKAALAVTPYAYRSRVKTILERVSKNLTRWLLGRLVAMLFVGVASSAAFALLHVPLALALGVLAGLLTFVEYVGAILSAVPPFLIALTMSPTTAVAVLGVFAVLHVLEGYVLTPILARASVRIPPAIALAAQVMLAALVGPVGMTFSTPLLAAAIVGVQTWREDEQRGRAGISLAA